VDDILALPHAVAELEFDLEAALPALRLAGQQADELGLLAQADAVQDADVLKAMQHESRVFVQRAVAEPLGHHRHRHHRLAVDHMRREDRVGLGVDFTLKQYRQMGF